MVYNVKKQALLISADVCIWQVGIYVLEMGLGKPEFLSEGITRMKKANQLMQKLMEYFYDFVIPGEYLVPMLTVYLNTMYNRIRTVIEMKNTPGSLLEKFDCSVVFLI